MLPPPQKPEVALRRIPREEEVYRQTKHGELVEAEGEAHTFRSLV